MDAFNFIHFLKNPGYLHQVTFQEINNLIEQYPFCQNLHYLALRKAQLENHKDFVKRLELAATYSPNRQWLFKQLKETETPLAISDETVTTDKEELLSEEQHPEMKLPDTVPDQGTSPAFSSEKKHTLIIKEVDEPAVDFESHLIDEEDEEELPNEQTDEIQDDPLNEFSDTTEDDTIPSHSISDTEQQLSTLMDTTDDSEPNLENPEDMKLPDDKDKRVIYMEDLVDNVPPLEESHSETEPDDNDLLSNPDFAQPESEEDAPQESASEDHTKEQTIDDIPFEIIDAREPEEHTDIPAEAEINDAESAPDDLDFLELDKMDDSPLDERPTESDHLEPEEAESIDQSASTDELTIDQPLAALDDNDETDFPENNPAEEDEPDEISIHEEGHTKDDTTKVTPLPKSAFSSWRQRKLNAPVKKKKKKSNKKKAKKEQAKITEVKNLFKKEKKKKKSKKSSKKKTTKRFAMESLLEHEDVISETLAELLAGQGRNKKAIKMYRSLMAKYPEKKQEYKQRIENLK